MSALKTLGAPVQRRLLTLERWLMGAAEPRTYAAVRIGFALAAAGIWLDLWPLREALFARSGSFGPPRPLDSLRFDVFQWVSSPAAVTALFVLVACAIVGLGLGLWQRLNAAIVYLWFVSYSTSAGLALGGFDTVGRLTSFVVLVSPVATAFTLWRPKGSDPARTVPSYGLRMLQWQLMLIYWVTFWLKAPDRYWRSGEVISHFGVSMFARFPDPAFADLGVWDPLLSWGTLLIELTVPVLLWKRNTRWFGLFLGLCLHGAIALFGRLFLFSLTMVPLYLAFLERRDFELMARCFARLRARFA